MDSIKKYCEKIGTDPLLVQGAGGNISWKEGEILWIKKTGKWLGQARKKDIFIPVDLSHLRMEIDKGNFKVSPRTLKTGNHRPSIETLMHVLINRKIVVHLHAVEILAWLVRKKSNIKSIMGDELSYVVVDYHKPGPDLAKAIFKKIRNKKDINIIFMKNHGIVIGGNDIVDIETKIYMLQKKFRQRLVSDSKTPDLKKVIITPSKQQYRLVDELKIQQLVFNKILFKRLLKDWALYPDHVVLIGRSPSIHKKIESFKGKSEIIFIENTGVYSKDRISNACREQLSCYYEILARQEEGEELNVLTPAQVEDLLDWDAEQFRKKQILHI